jgi:hypothetical protein
VLPIASLQEPTDHQATAAGHPHLQQTSNRRAQSITQPAGKPAAAVGNLAAATGAQPKNCWLPAICTWQQEPASRQNQRFFYRPVTPNRWSSVPVYRSGLPVTGRI